MDEKERNHLIAKLFDQTEEVKRLQTCLNVALGTLEQIAETPRNKGARRNAKATVMFLQTQMSHNV